MFNAVKYWIKRLINLGKLPSKNINKYYLRYLYSTTLNCLGKNILKNPIDTIIKILMFLIPFLDKDNRQLELEAQKEQRRKLLKKIERKPFG